LFDGDILGDANNTGIEAVYHMLASFAEKYAADDVFDR